jgi:hypothetical protein
MRNASLKGMLDKASPMKKKYDFTKKKEFGEGKIGKKIASAVTPKSIVEVIPTTKVIKAGKAVYNYLKG